MADAERSAEQKLADCSTKPDVDPKFGDLLRGTDSIDDSALAELIEQDGRGRLARGLPVALERYFDAVPDLMQYSDSLDAAIDVTLRSMSRSGRVDANSVETLVQRYPELEVPIREAAALTNALWSTTRVQQHLGQSPPRDLPQDFGPPIEDGRPRYELRKLLGSGAFGHVYLAVDRQLSEDDHPALVAVKVLSSRNRTAWSRQRLVEEATKARRIDHQNVVRVLDRGVSVDDEDFIVYELVDGGDLAQWLDNQASAISLEEAAKLIAQIARGVQAAHAAGLVHCDLKPGNVMLTTDGTPKVADFGVAIRAGDAWRPTNPDGSVQGPIGNLAYISPEQFRMDDAALNVPSDVYALGGMLFTLLTGELPNGSTLEEISRNHDSEERRTVPRSPCDHRPEIDRDLDAICRRAMAVKPEDRYSSAGSLADDLDAWRRREPLYWTKPTAWRVVRLWCRRKPALASLSVLLIASIVAGTLIVFHFSRDAAMAHAEREIERVRAEEQAQRVVAVRTNMIDIVGRMESVIGTNEATMDIFPAAWAIELAAGRGLLGTPDVDEDLWELRLSMISKLIADAERNGRSDDLETAMWKTTKAFWLVAKGDTGAEAILSQLKGRWERVLSPDDTYLGHLDAISAGATVNRFLRDVEGGVMTTSEARESEELHEAGETLDRWEQFCRSENYGSTVHKLVAERLRDLHSPLLLDNESGFQRAIEVREELDQYNSIGLR